MRKQLTTLLLSATLLSSSMAFAEDKVIATYKDGSVTESQVMGQFKDALQSQPALKDGVSHLITVFHSYSIPNVEHNAN